ncbi:Peptidase family M23 [Thermanaeromonas toyohensis ToBE]|uniref:Peptidase family M23 n=1 Tax=Thermanaeromonas toyohensis ToBE TaxID=698762 RepID=A0A1W1V8E8_9FIRM|nr:M23 family metallopeptidase [Thermanaeromonas toyohensis]SMB89513.1 Peptidase family M23 [Thermanaeromonas toyohensis ToBE]
MEKFFKLLKQEAAHLGQIGQILRRKGFYLLFLTALLAGTYYLVTNTAVFQGKVKVHPLPIESPAKAPVEPLPREALSGSETVPPELKDKTGAYSAQATPHTTPLDQETATKGKELTLNRPLPGKKAVSFGFAWSQAFGDFRFHPGLDLEGRLGEEVRAATSGTVSLVEYSDDWRYRLVIDAGDGYQVIYAHLDSVKVTKGSKVKPGDVLGTLGQPGRAEASSSVHLHLELKKNGQALDPAPYLQ